MPHTILVTGASRGLGLEFVRQCRERGNRVIGVARTDSADLRALAHEVILADVTDADGLSRLGRALEPHALDILINNAGVSSQAAKLEQCTPEELERVFRVNTIAPLMVVRAALPALRRGSRRLVVNISSQLGSIANNTGGSSYPYRASKCALNMLTVCLANEFRPDGIAFVAMHPGWVRTDMGGPKAPLAPHESVRAMLATIGTTPGHTLSLDHSGAFLNYDGATLPW